MKKSVQVSSLLSSLLDTMRCRVQLHLFLSTPLPISEVGIAEESEITFLEGIKML